MYFAKDCAALLESEVLFLIASYQLGTNVYQEEEFLLTKQRSSFLCSLLYDVARCENIGKQSPFTVDDLSWENQQERRHIQNYFRARYPQGGKTSFDLFLWQQIEEILTRHSFHRQQREGEDCCVVILDDKGDLLSFNVCREVDDPQG